MKSFKAGTLILILLLSTTSCFPPGKPKVITSKDGRIQLTIPARWKEDLDLHKEASLQASDRANEMYVVVLAENKGDFDSMTLERYADIIRSSAQQGAAASQASTPTRLTINGNQAMQCEIRGTVDNIKVTYLQVAAETPKRFYQILTWTLSSSFDKNRSQLEEVIKSFKEVDSTSAK